MDAQFSGLAASDRMEMDAMTAPQEAFFSQSWYRAAKLTPRLRSHVLIHRHTYRGHDWYVIQDKFSGRYHRFSPEAYYIIGLLNGRLTLAQIWENACEKLGDDMPTQDEVIQLLSQLFQLNLLQTSVLPDYEDLFRRHEKSARARLMQHLRSPTFIRIPVFDPDRFLVKTLPWITFLFSKPMFIVWLALVVTAAVFAGIHWTDLTHDFTDHVFRLENILAMSLIYPVLKIFHEFGHAYMVKKWSGEVHEMGVLLLVFMPIPYVDASSSLAFREKYKRVLVGAAGIIVELGIASLALLAWLNVEPGLVRAICYNTMMIAGVSTLLFNGNPLLRFDAYYVFADLLEIPNLGQRSTSYVSYLIQRWLLGITDARSPAQSPGEAAWLLAYGLLSFCYRIFITFRIILFIAARFFFVGIVLALWVMAGMVVMPLWKMVQFIQRDRNMKTKKVRILLVALAPVLFGLAGLLLYPFASSTVCEGVTWAAEKARVVAQTEGFIAQIVIPNGSRVQPGDLLMVLKDPRLDKEVRLLEAKRMEYQARYDASLQGNRTETSLLKVVLGQLDAQIARAKERAQALWVKSQGTGRFFVANADDMPGHFVYRGQTIGFVLGPQDLSVRVVVEQDDIEQVRNDTTGVSVRLAENIGHVIPAKIVREVPAASKELPSRALSLDGGGKIALDTRSANELDVLNRLFQFDLHLEQAPPIRLEQRVFVRFSHSPTPLWLRGYDALRRLLLRRFAV